VVVQDRLNLIVIAYEFLTAPAKKEGEKQDTEFSHGKPPGAPGSAIDSGRAAQKMQNAPEYAPEAFDENEPACHPSQGTPE